MANQRILVHTRNPELPGLGIPYFGHYINLVSRYRLNKEHHGSCYEIAYLENGTQIYCTYPKREDGEETVLLHRLYGGDVFIAKPYEYHSTGTFSQMRGSLYWIHFDSGCRSLLAHTPERSAQLQFALASLTRHVIRCPPSVASRMTEAFHVLDSDKPAKVFRACELLSLFILELAECNGEGNSQSGEVNYISGKGQRAVSYIRENLFSPDLDVQSVADALHFSRSYLMSVFRKEVGMTIHEFIMYSRIEAACRMLQTHSITEISMLLCFSSSQHFSRAFKEFTGMTPKQYLRSQREREDHT